MKRTLSAVTLSALIMVGTSCAHDTLKQLKKDVFAGAKLGAGAAVVFSGGRMVTQAAANKINQSAPTAAQALQVAQVPLCAVILAQHSDKVAEIVPSKESSLQSQAVQLISIIAAYFGTNLVIKQIAVLAGSLAGQTQK